MERQRLWGLFSVLIMVTLTVVFCYSRLMREATAGLTASQEGDGVNLERQGRAECNCGGESVCFSAEKAKLGRPFNCTLLPLLEGLGVLGEPWPEEPPPVIAPVFATAVSDNHFLEGSVSIAIRQSIFPNATNFLFDLGLSEPHREEAEGWCGVKVAKLDKAKFGGTLTTLKDYRWKPLVIAEVLQKADWVWWVDASVRWVANEEKLRPLYQSIRKGIHAPVLSAVNGNQVRHSIFKATHPGMYEFLPIANRSAQLIPMSGAGCNLYVKTRATQNFLKWWLLCALDEDCMAPPGANVTCDRRVRDGVSLDWAGCHRFDQSAFAILAHALFRPSQATFPRPILTESQVSLIQRNNKGARPLNCTPHLT